MFVNCIVFFIFFIYNSSGFNTGPLIRVFYFVMLNQGAEVVRMYKTLLGTEGFRKVNS